MQYFHAGTCVIMHSTFADCCGALGVLQLSMVVTCYFSLSGVTAKAPSAIYVLHELCGNADKLGSESSSRRGVGDTTIIQA